MPIGRDRRDAKAYLKVLIKNPLYFVEFLRLIELYTKICPQG